MKKVVWLSALAGLAVVVLGATGVLTRLFSADYLPHRYCYLAKPGLVWTNVVMDSLIAASYAVIFGCLFWIANRLRPTPKIKPFLWIFFAFGIFIAACGATHFMDVVTVWLPVYPFSAAVKVVCALASIPTAVLFARTTPRLASSIIRFIDLETELVKANDELREFSARDALTELQNRGRFDAVFAYEWARATRSSLPLSVLFMDIDHFKMLNDRHGHLAGDECLRRVARVLSTRRGRAEDLSARYGGEEFAVILPGADHKAALYIAEEIRRAVLGLEICNEDSPTSPFVTVSIGTATHSPRHTENPSELLAAADAALYIAKRNGRNRSESGDTLLTEVPSSHDLWAEGLGQLHVP